jgi:hypothetical protein
MAKSIDPSEALRIESEFLSGVLVNFEQAKGKQLRGQFWNLNRKDEEERLRATMARHRLFDRDLLKQLPKNRSVVLEGFERRWVFLKRPTGTAIASVMAPFEHVVAPDSADATPVDLGQLRAHVERLINDEKVPHVIGVCSVTGFTEDAKRAKINLPNTTVVLIEPRAEGGYAVCGNTEELPESAMRLFDPENELDKIERVRQAITESGAELITGGLSASSIAGRVGLPEEFVKRAVKQIDRVDPELRVSAQDGDVLVFRGAPVGGKEKKMNVIDRIRAMFDREGDEAQKINLLSERRALLAKRRDRLYEDIGKLEEREANLLNDGKSATSAVVKRRLASQLAQLRKDISRLNTSANMLNQQMNIISTDIHNLTLIQQGQMAKLPNTEELTENAVKAEEMLETLQADADMVSGLETGMAESMTSDEELAILAEFDETPPEAAPVQAAPTKAASTLRASTSPADASDTKERDTQPAPPESSKHKSGPEAV